jgi:predicted enzyme related to lactoylglutathione lyase
VITGVHAIIYSKHVDRIYAFLREALGLAFVDAGEGRLMFAGPPLEIAAHETDGEPGHEFYFICDDVHSTVEQLAKHDVEITMPITDRGWGLVTRLRLPGGDEIGLYEPRHFSLLHR